MTDPSLLGEDPPRLRPQAHVVSVARVFEGEVVAASPQEIVLRREDPDLGEIALHFPRAGYLIRPR